MSLKLQTPKFSILEYHVEEDYWSSVGTRNDFNEALEEKRRLEGKGVENLSVVGLSFIVGPKALGQDEY
jgi:hypothetical protein